jgi:hypothetical protein
VNRPSLREIDKRLKEAKDALCKRRTLFANPAKVVEELSKLEIGDSDEIWELILLLLEELQLTDYKGGHPPQKSYERAIAECELWAFSWTSPRLKKQMHLKFALREGIFYYVSLHESKFGEEKKEKR